MLGNGTSLPDSGAAVDTALDDGNTTELTEEQIKKSKEAEEAFKVPFKSSDICNNPHYSLFEVCVQTACKGSSVPICLVDSRHSLPEGLQSLLLPNVYAVHISAGPNNCDAPHVWCAVTECRTCLGLVDVRQQLLGLS